MFTIPFSTAPRLYCPTGWPSELVDRVRGFRADTVILDETAEMSPEVMEQALAALRRGPAHVGYADALLAIGQI